MCINVAGTAIQWSNKMKYFGLCICGNSGHTEVSDNIPKFYGQYNNIRSVLGYGTREMCTVHPYILLTRFNVRLRKLAFARQTAKENFCRLE